jgi:DNA polymerase-3 subunit beta
MPSSDGTVAAFTFNKADLVRELSLAVGSVERQTTIPILSNVRLDASDFGHVTITATDLEIGMRCQFPATVKKDGSATLPAKRLLDYVRLLPGGDVDMKFTEQFWATINAGRAKTRIAGMSADSFPELPSTPDDAVQVPARVLVRLIQRVVFAISNKESRFTLNGALFEITEGTFRMVATDGHRLAYSEIHGGGRPQKALIPKKALLEVVKLVGSAPSDATVQYAADSNHLFFTVGDRSLTARKCTGNFPDYERALPKEFRGTAMVPVAEMKGAIERARILTDYRHSVKLAIADRQVTITSIQSETGNTEESLPAEIDGPDLEIGLNSDYLVDFLAVCGSEKAVLSYSGAEQAIQMTPVGDGDGVYKCVVMPLRF